MSPVDSVLAATSPAVAAPVVVREKVPTAAAVGDLETATAQTVAKMCEYIDAGSRDPVVRAWATQAANMYGGRAGPVDSGDSAAAPIVTGGVPRGTDPPADPAALCWAVFWLVKHAVKYAHDEPRLFRLGEPGALDLLIAPAVLVRMRKPKEDCDGFTMLICAMLRALLVESYIVTVAADPKDPSRWSHVFAMAKLPDGTFVPLDCSHGGFPGWMVPAEHIFRWQAWQLNGRPADDVKMPRFSGLHGYTRPGSKIKRRGMGDCLNSQVNMGMCPDGSAYTGTLDTGGAAPTQPLAFPYVTTPAPAPAPAPGYNWDATIAGLLGQGVGIAKSVLAPPTYQSTYNPATGQTSTTIYGTSAVGSAALPLGLGMSPNVLLIGGALLVGLLIFSSMKGGR